MVRHILKYQQLQDFSECIGMLYIQKSTIITAQKMTFSIKHFFRKCDQICRSLRIWSHLLKKSLIENFIFCAVFAISRFSSTLHYQLMDTLEVGNYSGRSQIYIILPLITSLTWVLEGIILLPKSLKNGQLTVEHNHTKYGHYFTIK